MISTAYCSCLVVASSPCSSEGIIVRNLLFDDRSRGRGIAAEDLMDESSVLLRGSLLLSLLQFLVEPRLVVFLKLFKFFFAIS